MKMNMLVTEAVLGLQAIANILLESSDNIVTMTTFTRMCNMSLKLIYNFQIRNDAHIARYLGALCVSKLKYTLGL